MPHIPFLLLALLIGAVAYWRITKEKQAAENNQSSSSSLLAELTPQQAPKELSWDDVQPVDMIGLEVGYRLISIVDKEQGGELLERIKGGRKKLSQDFGFLIPAVHIRDNLELPPNCYRISLMGVTCGEANIHPNMELAINPGQVYGNIDGEMTKICFWFGCGLGSRITTRTCSSIRIHSGGLIDCASNSSKPNINQQCGSFIRP